MYAKVKQISTLFASAELVNNSKAAAAAKMITSCMFARHASHQYYAKTKLK